MRYGVVGPDGVVRHFVGIDLPGPRLPHDMAITEHHSILMDLPLVTDPEAARAGRHKLLLRPRHAEPLRRASRATASADDVRWFEADPCYIYHSVNAREEGDEIVLDVCRVKQPEPRSDLDGPLAQMLSYLRLDAHLHRYRFDLRTGQHDRAGARRRQQRVPVDQPGLVGRPLALRLQHAHLAREHAALRRADEVRHRAPARPRRIGSATGAGAARRRSRRGPAPTQRTTATSSPTSTTSARGARRSRCSTPATSTAGPVCRVRCRCACRSASTRPGCRASAFPGDPRSSGHGAQRGAGPLAGPRPARGARDRRDRRRRAAIRALDR